MTTADLVEFVTNLTDAQVEKILRRLPELLAALTNPTEQNGGNHDVEN